MIKLISICGQMHRAKIVAVAPVALVAELLLHLGKERCAGQRIGEGDTYVVGPRLTHQAYGFGDLRPLFPGVAELQKVAGTDTNIGETPAAL